MKLDDHLTRKNDPMRAEDQYSHWDDFLDGPEHDRTTRARCIRRRLLYDPRADPAWRTVPKHWWGVFFPYEGGDGETEFFDTQEETEAWILARVILG